MAGGDDTLQSVARAIGVLEAIAIAPASSAQQLAGGQGLRLSTTYHILKTLLVHGYVVKDNTRYRLGPRIGFLAQALERDLQPDPQELVVMRRIVESVGETAYLSRWLQGDVVISAVAEGRHPVRVSGVHVGLRGHAYARASGKVLLAFGPPERLRAYLAIAELEALTPNTRSTREEVLAEIAATRARGYALDEQEFTPGVCCIAMPIAPDEPGGASLALTVSLPATRYESVRERVVHELRAAVDDLANSDSGARRPTTSAAAPMAHPAVATKGG